MSALDRGLLLAIAGWDAGGEPITSLYLTVDGRRYLHPSDYHLRLDELLRSARGREGALDREAARSVERDLAAMSAFVREEFRRGDTRGLALFSSSAAGLWEVVPVPRPVRDRVVVAPHADVMPLEALLESYPPVAVLLVDYAKARMFVVEVGRIEEVTDVVDDVPNRHDQGGWAQMRMQRHVDDHRSKHLKHTAQELFALSKRRPFDHLVVAGPAEAHREIELVLHDYLRRRIRASLSLPMTATAADVLARVLEIEEAVERDRERAAVERLAGATSSNGAAVAGLEPTLEALATGRVGQLVVAVDASAPGYACVECGRLAATGGACPSCAGETGPVPDVVDAAVNKALRTGANVETVLGNGLDELGGIGALLRF
jgi:peptide subunit release factor 1 (eRF1)